MRILQEQMEAFRSVADEPLARRIVDHLRTEYSGTTVQLPSGRLIVSEIADDEIKAMVLIRLSRALGYATSWTGSCKQSGTAMTPTSGPVAVPSSANAKYFMTKGHVLIYQVQHIQGSRDSKVRSISALRNCLRKDTP